ncbi:Multifunctional cyclase-dehydratase-3-O-methyl transferase TcmN [Streptomyces sp. RB5]|uniref:Multifunctional cyclase-dehydratase-3-O-methyl transferase TcmN n=1 Tax=Streptomyces smaragdinus TaxID=2585196 RepID=A0A7K0CDQ5_9ACTN|nr:methyltransferase [Streptomyces smaragdinus]MQY11609.1 Multifunctional cyclase-dehydratase-3-O-methyl transferase TcmN [Streptomyces smaragdinus]
MNPQPTTAPDTGAAPQGVTGWFDPGLPEQQQVLGFLYAKWAIGALRAVVELRVPDLLAQRARTVAELAAATGADADNLYRVLRAVAAAGVLHEDDEGRFSVAPLGAGLVSGAEGGIREMFLFASDPMLWRPYENLAHTVRTGEPAFVASFGAPFYEYTKAHPEKAAVLDKAMLQNKYPGVERVFAGFDFGRFATIADVGGGRGHFLAEVLRDNPRVTGVLADQPHTVAESKEVFEGLEDRVTVVGCDFFVEVPAGCDAYFIKHTLHNWDNAHATRILRTIRKAIGDNPDARLLIVENLLRGPGEWDIGKLIDIESLAVLGGRERSLGEWNRVAGDAGFTLAGDPVPGDIALLEYRPV